MLALTEAEIAAIQAAYHAADELRWLFPIFADREDAQSFAVGIVAWRPVEAPMPKTTRLKRKCPE